MNLIILFRENHFSQSKRYRTSIFKLILLINDIDNNKIKNV